MSRLAPPDYCLLSPRLEQRNRLDLLLGQQIPVDPVWALVRAVHPQQCCRRDDQVYGHVKRLKAQLVDHLEIVDGGGDGGIRGEGCPDALAGGLLLLGGRHARLSLKPET